MSASRSRLLALAATVAALGSLLAACTIDGDEAASGPTTTPTTEAPPTTAATADPGCNPDNARPSFPPTSVLPVGQAGGFMETIRQRGRLIVGVSQDTYLFSYFNPESGLIEGFDVDIAKEVARAIFGDPEKVELKAIAYADRLPLLESGAVDLVADTMTINCTRWARINFSSVYYEAGQDTLVGKDSEAATINDLQGKKVCAATGSTSIDNVIKALGREDAVDSPDWATCLVRLQQGEVDAVSTDDTILAGLAAQDPYTRVLQSKFTEEPYGLGVSKDHPEFVGCVNGVLERMRADGTWQTLYDNWLRATLGAQTPPPAGPTRPVR
jgi:polar amino acid transport system substrate-binding protein